MVLGVAAVTSVITRRLQLPSVLGYLVAGIVIGPYTPIPLFADHHRVESLSEFGVILVMFAVGLEFRLKRFFQVLPTSGFTAVIEISTMGLSGIIIGQLLGWNNVQSFFLGGALAISSTMIVSKVFEEFSPTTEAKEHIFGILVIQDIVAIILLTLLGTVAAGSGLGANELIPTISKLIGVLFVLVIVGIFVIPRFIKLANSFRNSEVTIIAATGVCFSIALLVENMGFSVALGAFLAGMLVSESGDSHRVEHLTRPLKDVFSAIFFVSVGMTVNPDLAVQYLPTSLLISAAIIFLQFLSVSTAGILSGAGYKKSLMAGLTLGQIGEFAFIISSIGAGANILPPEFQVIVVSVALLTSLATPILWTTSPQILNSIDSILPERLRMLIGIYEEWFERIRTEMKGTEWLNMPKRITFAILFDTFLLIILPPSFFNLLPKITRHLQAKDIEMIFAQAVPAIIFVFILLPIVYSLSVNISKLVSHLTEHLFPTNLLDTKFADLSAKKLFQMTLQTSSFIIIGLLVMAGIKPFINFTLYLILLLFGLFVAFWFLWKTAGKYKTDIESGAETILNVLSKQSFPETPRKQESKLPGFKNTTNISITNETLYGKSLRDLNLKVTTGAKIVVIQRDGDVILFPTPQEKIKPGDKVVLTGDTDALQRGARALSNDES